MGCRADAATRLLISQPEKHRPEAVDREHCMMGTGPARELGGKQR